MDITFFTMWNSCARQIWPLPEPIIMNWMFLSDLRKLQISYSLSFTADETSLLISDTEKFEFFLQTNGIFSLSMHTFCTNSSFWKIIFPVAWCVLRICLRYMGFPFALCQSVHMHMLWEPGLETAANSNFVYLPSPKPIVHGIRSFLVRKITAVCILS